jgi:hypothetical protein
MAVKSSIKKIDQAGQEVKKIKLKDLVLWTENPRDPIDPNGQDQDVVDRSLGSQSSKWSITKLAFEMGDYYDFSELPTVVMHGKKPVVYDGNRRMILGKLKHKQVKADGYDISSIPDFPDEIPCNVCSKEIALKNVLRKHGESGSWLPLERDIFLNKHMGQAKSIFLQIEESTGLISSNNQLNQRFVKEEILKEDILKEMGFELKGNKLWSTHTDKQAAEIFTDIAQKVEAKKISTRVSRGKVIEVLDKKTQEQIDNNKDNELNAIKVNFRAPTNNKNGIGKPRLTKRKQKKEEMLFGGKLYLNIGDVSDLYRDIDDLYNYYLENRDKLSPSFASLIRMALRLFCETAAKENNVEMKKYIETHFTNAKKSLTKDIKTTLSNQNVTETSLVQLLHTGAHNYQSSNNIAQTIAVSIIVGEMIKLSHGKTK